MAEEVKKPFDPVPGKVYRKRGGGEYICVTPLHMPYPAGEARMRNLKTGWTFRAMGVVLYEDGTIEWDYSRGGYLDLPQ